MLERPRSQSLPRLFQPTRLPFLNPKAVIQIPKTALSSCTYTIPSYLFVLLLLASLCALYGMRIFISVYSGSFVVLFSARLCELSV